MGGSWRPVISHHTMAPFRARARSKLLPDGHLLFPGRKGGRLQLSSFKEPLETQHSIHCSVPLKLPRALSQAAGCSRCFSEQSVCPHYHGATSGLSKPLLSDGTEELPPPMPEMGALERAKGSVWGQVGCSACPHRAYPLCIKPKVPQQKGKGSAPLLQGISTPSSTSCSQLP